MRTVLTVFAFLLALVVTAAPAAAQSAPTPVVSGTLKEPSQNAAWGTWEGFSTTTNTFGFWMRFKPTNGHVYTVVPFEMQADGQLACWYIEYAITGASDPNKTEGWQWQEVSGGRVLLNPATATSTTIDGSMFTTYTMIGFSRVAEQNPRVSPIRLSVP